MKRILSIAAMAALMAALLPLGVVAAHDSDNHGNGQGDNGHRGKVTICHNPNGAQPVTITVSKSSWKARAHMRHGDTLGPCVPKPKPPKPTAEVCTFSATATYTGANGTSVGPITFKYTKPTASASGVVMPGGTWTEPGPLVDTITGGTVPFSGVGVSLKFSRAGAPVFDFNGNLLAGNNLSGLLIAPWPTNTFVTTGGSVTCSAPPKAETCTFVGSAQYVRVPPSTGVSTGPLRFSWATATGTVSGGSWDELYLGTHYVTAITGGMIGTATANVSFLFAPSFSYTFAGTITKPATGPWTLSGALSGSQPAGNQFTASGTVNCNGRETRGGHDDDD